MRKLLLCLQAIIITSFLFPSPSLSQVRPIANGPPKYVFLFFTDGAGAAQLEIARHYSRHMHNEGMVIVDKIMKEGSIGIMTTHAADSLSPDSASAATAMANGCKANIGALGVCADGSPTTNAMELARRRGMKLGLITNSTIYDASPRGVSLPSS